MRWESIMSDCSACSSPAGVLVHPGYFLCGECSRRLDVGLEDYRQTWENYKVILIVTLSVLALVAAFVLQPLVTG
jgi:hypothetical protein